MTYKHGRYSNKYIIFCFKFLYIFYKFYNHSHREDHLSLMKGQKDDPYVAVPRLADALAADMAICLGQAASKDTTQSG
jgi:hypothetical protein